jgi:hypothetical protein
VKPSCASTLKPADSNRIIKNVKFRFMYNTLTLSRVRFGTDFIHNDV